MGNEVTDTKMIAEVCNEHFVTIGKKLAYEIVQTGDSSPYAHLKRADTQFKFKLVTADQIQQTISKLISSKATGIHNLPNKVLKATILDKSVETFEVSRENLRFSIAFIWTVVKKKQDLPLAPSANVGLRERQVHIGVCPGGLGKVKFT